MTDAQVIHALNKKLEALTEQIAALVAELKADREEAERAGNHAKPS